MNSLSLCSIVPPNVKIWTLLTATFYENSIIFVCLTIVNPLHTHTHLSHMDTLTNLSHMHTSLSRAHTPRICTCAHHTHTNKTHACMCTHTTNACVCTHAHTSLVYAHVHPRQDVISTVDPLQTILDVIALIGFSTVLEPLWSFREFLVSSGSWSHRSGHDMASLLQVFSAVVSVVSLLSGAMVSVLLYAIAQSFSYL